MRTVRLGGLFPLTSSGVRDETGSVRLLSALLAIEEINNSSTLLPDVNLTLSVRDSRRESTAALRGALELSGECMSNGGIDASSVVAIIGASSSTATTAALRVVVRQQVPLISYASTSPTLSDAIEFPQFARVVPADDFQAEGLVALIQLLGYTRVATVSSAETYGAAGIAAFHKAADRAQIEIMTSQSFEPGTTDLEHASRELRRSRARVIVLFCPALDAGRVIRSALEEGVGGPGYVWIGSDAVAQESLWSNDPVLASDTSLRLSALRGFFGLVPSNGRGTQAYDDYRVRLTRFAMAAASDHANCSTAEDADGAPMWLQDSDEDVATPPVCVESDYRLEDAFAPFSYDAVRVSLVACARSCIHALSPSPTCPQLCSRHAPVVLSDRPAFRACHAFADPRRCTPWRMRSTNSPKGSPTQTWVAPT
jgi:ABC-type branched-subunit amino acid transport system substrate-binding protein